MKDDWRVITKAAKGDKGARGQLISAYGPKLMFFCRRMYGKDAPKAFTRIWDNLWRSLASNGNPINRTFTSVIWDYAARFAKKTIQEKNPSAFRRDTVDKKLRVPHAAGGVVPGDEAKELLLTAFSTVDERQRLMLLLRNQAGLDMASTAKALKLDEEAASYFFLTGPISAEKAVEAAKKKRPELADQLTYANLAAVLTAGEEKVPENLIPAFTAEEKAAAKKKTILTVVAAVAAVAIVIGGGSVIYRHVAEKRAARAAEEARIAEEAYIAANRYDGEAMEALLSDNVRHVAIDFEGYGTVTLALDADAAPLTVENFISLAESGFYDGLTIHRIQNDFVIQGGDPEHNGNGGSGTPLKGEFSSNGITNDLHHYRGAISMARRSNDNDSASSQFFICLSDCTAPLDGKYAGFGYVVDGFDVVQAIEAHGDEVDRDYIGAILNVEDQPVITAVRVLD